MMRAFERLAQHGKLQRIGHFGTMVHIAAVITAYQHHIRSVRPPHMVLRMLAALRGIVA